MQFANSQRDSEEIVVRRIVRRMERYLTECETRLRIPPPVSAPAQQPPTPTAAAPAAMAPSATASLATPPLPPAVPLEASVGPSAKETLNETAAEHSLPAAPTVSHTESAHPAAAAAGLHVPGEEAGGKEAIEQKPEKSLTPPPPPPPLRRTHGAEVSVGASSSAPPRASSTLVTSPEFPAESIESPQTAQPKVPPPPPVSPVPGVMEQGDGPSNAFYETRNTLIPEQAEESSFQPDSRFNAGGQSEFDPAFDSNAPRNASQTVSSPAPFASHFGSLPSEIPTSQMGFEEMGLQASSPQAANATFLGMRSSLVVSLLMVLAAVLAFIYFFGGERF